MLPAELIAGAIWTAARLRAEIEQLQKHAGMCKDARYALYITDSQAEAIGADLVNALAAQQLADHLHREIAVAPPIEA